MDKLEMLKTLIAPDTADDSLLSALIEEAGWMVLNRRYPYGVPKDATVPTRYEMIQCQVAVELFARMGAEGEMSHSEGGVTRSYEGGTVSQSLLKMVVPIVGSVSKDA